MWDPMWWDDEDDVDVLIELRLRFRRKVESATRRRSRSWSCSCGCSWGQARPEHECCTRSTAHQATRHACPYTNSLRLITRSERDSHSQREREWERENVWLRLWPERSKFVAMTHDYVDHYDSRQASKQAILIMMIEKPFARPGSLEWCQWLEINCPSIAQKDNNSNNQNNNRM